MSQSPRTVLPFVQGPELPSGGTLSSISLPEPFPQYVAIMTPFLTKAPLSRLRMMNFSLASYRYPETNSADRTSAPIAPNKILYITLLFKQSGARYTPLAGPQKASVAARESELVGVRYAQPDAALLEVPEPDPVEDTSIFSPPLLFPLPYRRHRSGKIQQDCYGQHPIRQDDEPQHGEKYLYTSSSP